MPRHQLKRGLKANLPTTGMLPGEPLFTTDAGTLYVALDATTKQAVVPAVDALSAMGTVDGTADLLLILDVSATGVQARKITIDALKTALNIPAGSADEKVAVVSGGTSGYLWGTDGTDGILRHGPGVSITKDAGGAFITLDVDVVDGGTF